MKCILNTLKGHRNRKAKLYKTQFSNLAQMQSKMPFLAGLVKAINYHLRASKIFPCVFRIRILTIGQASRNKKS